MSYINIGDLGGDQLEKYFEELADSVAQQEYEEYANDEELVEDGVDDFVDRCISRSYEDGTIGYYNCKKAMEDLNIDFFDAMKYYKSEVGQFARDYEDLWNHIQVSGIQESIYGACNEIYEAAEEREDARLNAQG